MPATIPVPTIPAQRGPERRSRKRIRPRLAAVLVAVSTITAVFVGGVVIGLNLHHGHGPMFTPCEVQYMTEAAYRLGHDGSHVGPGVPPLGPVIPSC